ncbi:low molecular weight protein-tyrosine-phosphatase [Glycocaulis abyssi]|uniref:protein-tyrosine-phosphatase n=1 Tax=Glycocaulis abyssi TaxID=1433403 RepID=A0ABV9NFM2_9PROT
MNRRTVSVLFVCTGNICRSPLAQGVAEAMAAKLNKAMVFDSAGTGDWHAGEAPDPRAVEAAARRGYHIANQRARALSDEDFARFDHIIGMDSGHKRWLLTARDVRRLEERPVSMLMDWSVGLAGKDVPDPYYGDDAAFEHALDLIEKGVDGLVRRM